MNQEAADEAYAEALVATSPKMLSKLKELRVWFGDEDPFELTNLIREAEGNEKPIDSGGQKVVG